MQTIGKKTMQLFLTMAFTTACLLVELLDGGDTRTLTKATEEEAPKDEIQPEDDTPQVSTRSGRRSARNKNSDFVFY